VTGTYLNQNKLHNRQTDCFDNVIEKFQKTRQKDMSSCLNNSLKDVPSQGTIVFAFDL
jgi:hypothetical protein